MITLYSFGEAFGLPDPSPFVMKADVLLKMSGLDFVKDTSGFRKAPKGKLPYIKDKTTIIPDSTFIRFYLEEKYGIDFDKNLSHQAKSLAWAIEKMLEEHLFFAIVYERWKDDVNFAKGPAHFFDNVPAPIRPFIKNMLRKKAMKVLDAQGFGRHSRSEIQKLALKDLEALSNILDDKPYLMGDTICGVDATAFAFVAGTLCPVFDTPLRDAVEKMENLVAYKNRLMKEFYPDLPH